MTVIAMTREMGTLGKDVAAGIADRTGMEVVHHELVERHLADRLKTTESTVHRFLEGEASLWERWKIDPKRLSRITAEEVLERAVRGKVLIRGWGAAQLLRDVPHVIRVRVCAPMSNRIREMKQRLGVESDDVVRREIERNDAAHARAVERQFNVDWRDATGYDIVINTGRVPIDTGVAMLQQLITCGAFQPTDESRGALKDKLVESRVRMVLDEQVAESPIGSSLNVTVHEGQVTIDGVVSTRTRLQETIAKIQSIEGVRGVTNQTVSVAIGYGP
jgi:cytidylate kinase